ncbi:MAG: hypothetical protein E6H07_16110 [Bacteroidetes bacterium]|nr:MAG: hypothetical protein E6H07_16110 [Bacteroidota bacterium]
MKKHILVLSALAVTLVFSSCKKETTKENDNDEIAAHAEDESQFSGELDGILNETNVAIESNGTFSGRYQSLQEVICDAAAVYDAVSNPRTITITFSGSNCNGIRTRTGAIVVSMAQGVQWKNAGAAVTIAFQNVKITRLRDNKSVTINGTQTYTNVSGGLLANLPILNSITHRINSSNLSLSFNDGTQRNWQVDKQRVFTYNNGAVITTTGLHTEGNTTGVAEWGTNRFGNAFTTAITSPLIIRQDCSFRLTAGAVEHKTNLFTGTATFGLNAAGNPTTCPGVGAYYFKVTWTGPNGNSYTTILPY